MMSLPILFPSNNGIKVFCQRLQPYSNFSAAFCRCNDCNWDPNINCSKNSCQKSRTGTNQLEAGKEVWSQIIPTQLVICFICTAPSQALLGFTAATPATRAAAMVRTYQRHGCCLYFVRHHKYISCVYTYILYNYICIHIYISVN